MCAHAGRMISLTEVPKQLLENVRERLWMHTVAVFAVSGNKPLYRGTATCMATSGNAYLLTAAHVWKALRGDRFALSLESDRLLVPINKSLVEPRVLDATGDAEWGPDLALIRIPDIIAADIRQVKAFYNLDKHGPRLGEPRQADLGLWVVVGAPEEQSSFGEKEAVLKICAFFSRIGSTAQRNGHDYLDLTYYHKDRPDLPRSYGGVSGAGLWQVPITTCPTSGRMEWAGQFSLEGVAFYQKFNSEEEGVIRCHGRISLLDRLLGQGASHVV